MMRALRAVSTEKGRDPADFVARRLRRLGPGARRGARGRARRRARRSCRRSPASSRRPGCCSPAPSTTTSASAASSAREPDLDALRAARRRDARSARPRIGDGEPEWRRVADVRYRGQSWSVPIELPGRARRGGDRRRSSSASRTSTSGSTARGSSPGSPVDIRALRLAALGPPREPFALPGRRARTASGTRRADFGAGPRRARRARRLARLARRRAGGRPAARRRVRHDRRRAARLDGAARRGERRARARARRGRRPTHGARTPTRSRMRLVANALETAADEMATTIFRTAHSAVVRDAMDFSAALCARDRRDGRAGGDDPAPARLDPERDADAARALRRRVRARATSIIVNDPFDGASHTPDIFVVKPSFARRDADRLRGHRRAPRRHRRPRPGDDARATAPRSSRRGCACRGCGSYAAGEPDEALFEIIRANVRIPHELLGDLAAQVAACHDRRPRAAGARARATAPSGSRR